MDTISANDPELTEEWKAELVRRWRCIENGTAKLITWEELKKQLESKADRCQRDLT